MVAIEVTPASQIDSGVISSSDGHKAASSKPPADSGVRMGPPPLPGTKARAQRPRAVPPPLSRVAAPVSQLLTPASRAVPPPLSKASAPAQSSPGGAPSAALIPVSSVPSREAQPMVPEQLGNCELRAEIARGGMARIYLGVQRGDEGFEKLVAVKKLLPEFRGNPDYVAMLVDEARISAHARHPFVRDVFQVSTAPDGSPYLVMEFLMGEPLTKVARALARPGARTVRELCHVSRLMSQVCEGLHAVHELTAEDGRPLGLVHRDVTPQNLFLLHNGTVRVTDFGIVQGEGRRQQTRGRALKGKLAYMSPEYLSRKPYGRQSDVWALGVVLWELAVGRRLFKRENDVAMLGAILDEAIPAPSAMRPGVDEAFDAIVAKALSRDTAKRYATAADLAADLERYIAEKREIVTSADLGKWLDALLPESKPTLKRMTDLARTRKASDVVAAPPVPPSTPGLGEDEDTMEVEVPVRDEAPSTQASSVQEVASPPKSAHLAGDTAPFSLCRRVEEHQRPTSRPPSSRTAH